MFKLTIRTCVAASGALLAMSVGLSAQTFTSLYSFAQQGAHGWQPWGSVVVGPQGQLYGTTFHGGAYTYGTVYEIEPPASSGGTWIETVLHSFGDQNGDVYPPAGLAMGPGGALYGVTEEAGSSSLPQTYGTVYQLLPPSGTSTRWPESILHQFTGGADGEGPQSSLTVGPGQALYGTTSGGSATVNGTVFRLTPPTPASGGWTETVLWGFEAFGPAGPQGTLAVYGDRIYGVTKAGGAGLAGTVFELAPPTVEGGSWTETTIYNFTGANGDGSTPYAGVVVDANGVLYGTTELGGSQACDHGGCGIVFP